MFGNNSAFFIQASWCLTKDVAEVLYKHYACLWNDTAYEPFEAQM